MKKADEIMELLGEELAGFEAAVKRLGELEKNLKEIKVKADSSNIEMMLRRHLDGDETLSKACGTMFLSVEQMVRGATLIPKWMTALFFLSSAILFLVMGYFGYQYLNIQKLKQAQFERGEKQILTHFTAYFDDNPASLTEYKAWIGKRDSIPKVDK